MAEIATPPNSPRRFFGTGSDSPRKNIFQKKKSNSSVNKEGKSKKLTSPKRGFFTMRSRKNKGNRKTSDASDATTISIDKSRNDSVSKNKSANLTRRVIKATPPPEVDPAADDLQSPMSQLTFDADKDGASERFSTPTVNPSPNVQKEDLREKTEQWRQERLNASAAIRKENKEKEVMEHRLRESGVDGAAVVGSDTGGREAKTEVEIPAILSVASKFPEHKRKAGSKRKDDKNGHCGKKTKVKDEDEEGDTNVEAEAETNRSVVVKNNDVKQSWITKAAALMAPAAIIAMTAILAMNMMRKRK